MADQDEVVKVTLAGLKKLCPPAYAKAFTEAKGNKNKLADLLYEYEKYRLEEAKKVAEIAKFQNGLEAWFIQEISVKEGTGVAGKIGRVEIKKSEIPTLEDEKKLMAFIKKKNATDLLQKPKLNAAAVKARWENNETVPGVAKFTRKVVSLTKVK